MSLKPMQLKPLSVAIISALTFPFHALAEDVSVFEPVVVTAQKIEQPLSKTNGSVAVITNEDLEREGATELYDALSHEPGVSVTGGAGRPQNITIRGMSGNRIAVVKDGVRVADGYGANDINDVAGFNSFDLGDVKQIEVVKGAGSSLYGSGAIGGVVVLTSKSPEDYLGSNDSYLDVEAGYSGISEKYNTAVTAAKRIGDTENLLRLSYWDGNETRNYSEDLYMRQVEGYNAALTSEWFVNDAWMLKGKVEYYHQNMLRNDGIPPVQEDGKGWYSKSFREDADINTLQAKLGAEWEGERLLADQADFSVYYRQTENIGDKDITMKRIQEGLEYQRRQMETRKFTDTLIGGSAEMQKQLETGRVSHAIAWGVELEWLEHERPIRKAQLDWNGNIIAAYEPFAAATTQRAGIYIHDMIELGQWNVTPSLRFDYQHLSPTSSNTIGDHEVKESSSSELSPSLAVGYLWTDSLNTYLSYSHGFRAPSYDKAYGYVPHMSNGLANFVITPNPDLKAETSDNFELGSKYDDGKLSVYGAVFYSLFDDFIDHKTVNWNEDIKASEVQYMNLDGVKTYGAELTAGYWFDSHFQLVSKLGIVDGEDDNGEPIRNLTPLEGNTELSYHKRFDAFVRVNYAGSMDRTPGCQNEQQIKEECATTSGWMTVDLGAGYDIIPDLRINVAIHNLFDREYTRYQDVAGVTESQTLYSSEPGRYFNVNAKYSF
ncbi:TonB-dependent hemoglobin/transferrin/lactoferrin family receptor [Photobacterium sp. SDRW27]|uniref:TonB-dependent hemoglobin/transferrin/lactoferrin family receptor n=1 Tax=Photobacterium obscurum TaxID=2829490 RepID=UPI00224475C8|nr:TonB-dependent hemoglobin/transferrin/lactoferrin family receptor [Photobacterium obscurum]MCW8332170.1 TonB-dependent hemoglobin/transferrin/lactoferrin family receptor [Photobacterium obscurum]